ncbi:MAG TPA: VWA domain-containing protein, partial [Nevskiaceae bacterium]
FFDIGGSMDPHIRVCEDLFSAARTEFKHLENYYFHNFVYESVWRDNQRRHAERTPLFELLNRYGPEYRVVFVGDATMSPYEILQAGGSVEHWNQEAGAVWLQRVVTHFPHFVWFNPERVEYWDRTPSISITRRLLGADRMYPLTLDGLEAGMSRLGH